MEQTRIKIFFKSYSKKQNKDVILTFIGDKTGEDQHFIHLEDRKIGKLSLNKKDIISITEIKKGGPDVN